ncbi:unnamed protein product [Thlaspi arvense]|uniref:Uncharacterized protein n=1 Tax=Thlaspi arvense TaxID=13288 RepID=A0AAU9SM99_THLAR|nr:unnamed protein product [Thlaspi arvense]
MILRSQQRKLRLGIPPAFQTIDFHGTRDYHQETLDYLKTAVKITKKLCDRVNLIQALIKWLEEESSSKF